MEFFVKAFLVLMMGLSSASASTKPKGGPPITCSENIACDNTEDNLIESIPGVEDLELCRQLCVDSLECQYITYYGSNSFPISEVCFLYRKCDGTHSCDECVSEGRGCSNEVITCGRNFVGKIGENLIETITGVKTMSACKDLCYHHYDNGYDCDYYTYFLGEETCYLLSSFMAPLQECENCVSGPKNCEGYEDCNLLISDGYSVTDETFYVFNYTYEVPYVHIPHPFGAPKCELRVLAVGAGGLSGNDENNIAGGGSGYFKYQTFFLTGPTVLMVHVGRNGSSIVTVNGEEIVAKAGMSQELGNGGDGFSGGGANCCSGGENGGDGVGGDGFNGGHGTGEDLTSIKFDHYVLSPGKTTGSHGGGGGGILINGYDDEESIYGYGAGECYYSSGGYGGADGVVILEIVNSGLGNLMHHIEPPK